MSEQHLKRRRGPRLTATQSEVAALDVALVSNDIGNLTAGSAFPSRFAVDSGSSFNRDPK
jgi:hypothetical protein